MLDAALSPELSETALHRTREIVGALRSSRTALDSPSALPEWSRLTIACHLRYGGRASLRMTEDALAGTETSFYPGGRTGTRPGTLSPCDGETPDDVVNSLEESSERLHERWQRLSVEQWQTMFVEPGTNPDLGSGQVALLAFMRLTEVEVHGDDLDLGLADWSGDFVRVALPTRLAWLATRRSNHRGFDAEIQGTWKLVPTDARSWLVTVSGEHVSSQPVESETDSDGVIEGTSRDLLALLLGRPTKEKLSYRGDIGLAERFGQAFPGP